MSCNSLKIIHFKAYRALDLIFEYVNSSPLIVEAGAFLGHDTLRMAKRWPQGMVYTFEPVAQLYNELFFRTNTQPNIKTYPLALSDQTGSALIYVAQKSGKDIPTQASSLHEPCERLTWSPIQFPYTIEVQTIRLDTWAKQNNIENIDLLWLDLQGHELNALYGAGDLLAKIKLIHAEVYFGAAYKNQPKYQEVIDMLAGHNFVPIAQDFTNTIDWHFGNIIFKNTIIN